MQPHRFQPGLFAALLLLICVATSLRAVELPEFSGEWVNGEPYYADDLKGKMMVLLFFEETAPEYKTLWAEMNKVKQPLQEKDNVIFIAIGSGAPKGMLMAYANTYGVSWRLLADESRAFEKQFNIHIDKQTYRKVFFVAPSGNCTELDTADFEKSVQAAVDQHKGSVQWRIPPEEVPPAAKPMWMAFEFGIWKYCCGAVQTNLRSREPKLKECAVKIDKMLGEIVKAKSEQGKKLLEGDDKWKAYKFYYRISEGFSQRPEARPAYNELTRLANLTVVVNNVRARAALDNAGFKTRDIATQPGTKAWYEAVVKNFPKTEAAESAQALIDSAMADAGRK